MLSISNLTHTYPNGIQALKNINLNISNGMFGLLGPNGSGKSSLMRTLATLQQPLSGRVVFDGVDALTQPLALRKLLGYLPQDFGVYPRGSAYELLDHVAVLKGIVDRRERKKVVEGLLVETNLYDMRKKRVATFSGGMRRRFGIAQALIGNPRLIIVDEPTGGLDPEERNRFHHLLSEIGRDKVVILSTHIVEDVADLCSQMAVMKAGEIVLQGAPQDLVKDLDGHIWKKVVDKAGEAACRANHRVISTRLSCGKTVVRVHHPSHPGDDFQTARPDLEDVFFTAMNGPDSATHNPTAA